MMRGDNQVSHAWAGTQKAHTAIRIRKVYHYEAKHNKKYWKLARLFGILSADFLQKGQISHSKLTSFPLLSTKGGVSRTRETSHHRNLIRKKEKFTISATVKSYSFSSTFKGRCEVYTSRIKQSITYSSADQMILNHFIFPRT